MVFIIVRQPAGQLPVVLVVVQQLVGQRHRSISAQPAQGSNTLQFLVKVFTRVQSDYLL